MANQELRTSWSTSSCGQNQLDGAFIRHSVGPFTTNNFHTLLGVKWQNDQTWSNRFAFVHLQAPERHASGAFAFLAQASKMATSSNMARRLGLGLYGIHGIQVARSRLDSWNVHSTVQLVAHPHDSHDTAIVFQILSNAGDDFHLKGRVGCRTPAERKQNGCTARALEVTKTFCLRDVRDVTDVTSPSLWEIRQRFVKLPHGAQALHSRFDGLHVWWNVDEMRWIVKHVNVFWSTAKHCEARECAWLLRDSVAFAEALFCYPRAHVRRFLLEWFFSRFSRSIIDISQSAGRKPGNPARPELLKAKSLEKSQHVAVPTTSADCLHGFHVTFLNGRGLTPGTNHKPSHTRSWQANSWNYWTCVGHVWLVWHVAIALEATMQNNLLDMTFTFAIDCIKKRFGTILQIWIPDFKEADTAGVLLSAGLFRTWGNQSWVN